MVLELNIMFDETRSRQRAAVIEDFLMSHDELAELPFGLRRESVLHPLPEPLLRIHEQWLRCSVKKNPSALLPADV